MGQINPSLNGGGFLFKKGLGVKLLKCPFLDYP